MAVWDGIIFFYGTCIVGWESQTLTRNNVENNNKIHCVCVFEKRAVHVYEENL